MKILPLLSIAALVTLPLNAAAPDTPPAEVMRETRNMWLTRAPEQGSYKRDDEVVAVVMDWPLGKNTITILASASGDASLYTTATFGIIGGAGHERVRAAAIAFVGCAQRYVKLMTPTKTFPYPDAQTLRLYVVTAAGVRTVSFPMKETEQEHSPARALFESGQNVLTELRQTVEQQE